MNPVKRRPLGITLSILCIMLAFAPATATQAASYDDPFVDGSYWTTPLPGDAERHPNSDQMIDFLADTNDLGGCVTLAGASGNSWGMPIFRADAGDPAYNVSGGDSPAFDQLHIPNEAEAAANSDGEMVVYDEAQGVVAQLYRAEYDGTWSMSGGSIAYLDGNGLDRRAKGGDPRNFGTFRGYNGAVTAVHYDEVAAGKVERVLKVGVNLAGAGHVFPLVGSDGDTTGPTAPPEGARLRIKPSVDLGSLGLSAQALVIARGLQEYGMIIGDNTGGNIVLKLEDTVRSGRGQKWNLERQSLCAISIHDFEVVGDFVMPPGAQGGSFTDTAGHIFRSEIEAIKDAGITRGCTPTKFCPNDSLTRGQMAAFLTRALDLPGAPSAGFTDTGDSIFREDINRLAAADITRGCTPSSFCPDRPLTRGQMAAFLARALDLGG